MKSEELKEKLRLHKMWLNSEIGGEKANLSGANLSGAKSIISFGPMPTSGRIIYASKHDDVWKVQAGYFWGTLDELESKVKSNHNCPFYIGVINLLRNTK